MAENLDICCAQVRAIFHHRRQQSIIRVDGEKIRPSVSVVAWPRAQAAADEVVDSAPKAVDAALSTQVALRQIGHHHHYQSIESSHLQATSAAKA